MPRTSPAGDRSLARLVARRLKALRSERNLNLFDVAERTRGRVARSTLGNFESFVSFPSLPALVAIAKALRAHPAELLLDPDRSVREAVAVAVLRTDDETLARVAAILRVT